MSYPNQPRLSRAEQAVKNLRVREEEEQAIRYKEEAAERKMESDKRRPDFITEYAEAQAQVDFYNTHKEALKLKYKDETKFNMQHRGRLRYSSSDRYLQSIKDTADRLKRILGEFNEYEKNMSNKIYEDVTGILQENEQKRLDGRGYFTRTLNGIFKKKSPGNPPPSNSVSQAPSNLPPAAPKSSSLFSRLFGKKPATGGRRSRKPRQKGKKSKTIKRRR
jgi:hypothetical protein